jgi:hypothetical protein
MSTTYPQQTFMWTWCGHGVDITKYVQETAWFHYLKYYWYYVITMSDSTCAENKVDNDTELSQICFPMLDSGDMAARRPLPAVLVCCVSTSRGFPG